jgi:hypothetical protein
LAFPGDLANFRTAISSILIASALAPATMQADICAAQSGTIDHNQKSKMNAKIEDEPTKE